jgi:hypothetical protein
MVLNCPGTVLDAGWVIYVCMERVIRSIDGGYKRSNGERRWSWGIGDSEYGVFLRQSLINADIGD